MSEVPLSGPQTQRSRAGTAHRVPIMYLVLWCFVLNPHRRPPYSEFAFDITRYTTNALFGRPNRTGNSEGNSDVW